MARAHLPISLLLIVGPAAACTSPAADAETTTTSQSTTTSSGGSTTESSATSSATTGPATCAATPEMARDCIEKDRYVQDLEFIAMDRDPGSMHWQNVQNLCADRFAELGFEVDLMDYGSGINVIGRKLGTDLADEIILFGAHYDHIPGCAGADDNATGVAGLLEVSRVLSMGTFRRTLMVACWDEEELGLIGSAAFASAVEPNNLNIAMHYNFEMLGYKTDEPDTQSFPNGVGLLFPQEFSELEDKQFRGDFIAIIGDNLAASSADALEAHADAIGLPSFKGLLAATAKNSPQLADFRRSDHAPFWALDIPALFLTDTSEFRYAPYHCMGGLEDTVDQLDHDFTTDVLRISAAAIVGDLFPE